MYNDLLERHTVLRVLAWLLAVIAALVAGGMIWSVIIHFGGVILLFFLAWVITFILQPLSIFLERRGMPRLLAVSLIYFALLAVSVGSIVLALPTIHVEVTLIAGEITATFTPSNLSHLADQAVAYLHQLGLSSQDARNLVSQVAGRIPQFITNLTNSAVATSTTLLASGADRRSDAPAPAAHDGAHPLRARALRPDAPCGPDEHDERDWLPRAGRRRRAARHATGIEY